MNVGQSSMQWNMILKFVESTDLKQYVFYKKDFKYFSNVLFEDVKASKRISYLGIEVANKFPFTEYTLPLLAGIITFFTTRSVAFAL